MSGLNSLLLHVAVITPVCQYLLTSPKFPKPRNFLYAVFFLAAVALAGEVSEWQSRPANFYRILEVDRDASASQLKAAYRQASMKYHPDKSKLPDAAVHFQAATEAHEVLTDPEWRKLYERYGATAVRDTRARAALAQRSDTDTLMSMAGFYIMWSVLTYLMTLGKARSQGRTWSFVGLIVALAVEFQMLFGGWDPAASVLTRTPLHEKVALLHSLYPAFMHGCILLSQFTFNDLDTLQLLMMQTILNQQAELRDILRHVVQVVDKKNGAAVAAGSSAGGGSADGGKDASEESLTLAQRLKRQEVHTSKAMAEAQQKQKSGGIPSWAIMIGMYVIFNYLLK
jgi:hypothetical protein